MARNGPLYGFPTQWTLKVSPYDTCETVSHLSFNCLVLEKTAGYESKRLLGIL